ncbi:aminotransferase class V-fold PLP-dependent enzyme, partial [Pseudomonas sp. 2995-1]|uniref:aminotransferase class V-fold PLP-dependent enzyme n=1 Tax=Pseudomonas sp. 2995-1 TaxID=1712679 RepID=UPI00117B0AEA
KIHGLKGTGILLRRNSVLLDPLFSGGSQEGKFRAGTENVPGAVAMVKALRITLDNYQHHVKKIDSISRSIEMRTRTINGVYINSPEKRAPHILNISIPGLKPEVVVQALS